MEEQYPAKHHECLDAKALASILSLSKRQVFRLNRFAAIPRPIRIGGSVRWVAQEIYAWIQSGCPDRQTWEKQKEVRK